MEGNEDAIIAPIFSTGGGGVPSPQGPKGDVGPAGPQGPQGFEGPPGAAGPRGERGLKGETGNIGATGPRGLHGDAGEKGDTGDTGATGADGKDGVDGAEGPRGPQGLTGDKGDDGKSVQLVGKFKTKEQFMAKYPLFASNVGKAGLCGDDPTKPKELWAITQDSSGAMPYPPIYSNLGDIRGPKGEDARWEVSLRDQAFTEKLKIVVDSDVDPSVASMYIRETESIVLEGLTGSEIDPKQVGFKIAMRHPIPRPAKKDDASGKPSTVGKVLSNDGEKLQWIDAPEGGKTSKDQILIKALEQPVQANGFPLPRTCSFYFRGASVLK